MLLTLHTNSSYLAIGKEIKIHMFLINLKLVAHMNPLYKLKLGRDTRLCTEDSCVYYLHDVNHYLCVLIMSGTAIGYMIFFHYPAMTTIFNQICF